MLRKTDRLNLTSRLNERAQDRLAWLYLLSYDELLVMEQPQTVVERGWLFRGSVWTEIVPVAPDTLRAAVLQTATCRLWPAYYHAVHGFRISRGGMPQPLTLEDQYELD